MKPRTSLSSRFVRGTTAALTALSLVAASASTVGCSSTPRNGGNTAGQWQGQGAFGGQPQGGGNSYGTNPNAVVQQNLPPVMNDPINNMDFGWMRQRAAIMLNELVANLGPQQRAKVEGIPLVSDDEPGEVNAYAGCRQGSAFMATTDGLLEVVAYSARARATDEVLHIINIEG
jgi:hypothetical protein